jgi:hypothetical protein
MSDPLTPNCREAPRGPRVLRIGVSRGKANFWPSPSLSEVSYNNLLRKLASERILIEMSDRVAQIKAKASICPESMAAWTCHMALTIACN